MIVLGVVTHSQQMHAADGDSFASDPFYQLDWAYVRTRRAETMTGASRRCAVTAA
jgi:hypothetical protein